jgi:hypothetical protein
MSSLLWLIPTGLLAVLLGLMLRSSAHRAWPWFFSYVTFGISADVARFAAHNHPHPYYFIYWLTDAGYAILGALAMYEILRKVLRGLADIWWTHLIFPALVATGVGLSLWRAQLAPPRVQGLLACVVVGEIAVRFVQILVFVGLVGFIALFGFRWRQYPLGIAAGFGLYSTVALLITTKLSDIGTRFTFLWSLISVVAYSVTVLIWIGFFSVPEKEQPPLDAKVAKHYIALLERYLNVLRRTR